MPRARQSCVPKIWASARVHATVPGTGGGAGADMKRHRIGGFTAARVVEIEPPLATPAQMFPDFDPEIFRAHAGWLTERDAYDPVTDMLKLSIHSWVLRTKHHTIVIDTCCGNDRERPKFPIAHHLDTPYLDNLRAAGVDPDKVDFVCCTHLHVDHVGWNTRLENGRWVPTFRNARYLFSKADYDHWDKMNRADPAKPANYGAFDDGVLPVVSAGLATFVDGARHELEDDVAIEPAPGHTPGSVMLAARSEGAEALFIGDAMHHPLQIVLPDWSSRFCVDRAQAARTRRAILERCVENRSLLAPAHFKAPHACRVHRDGAAYRAEFVEMGEA